MKHSTRRSVVPIGVALALTAGMLSGCGRSDEPKDNVQSDNAGGSTISDEAPSGTIQV